MSNGRSDMPPMMWACKLLGKMCCFNKNEIASSSDHSTTQASAVIDSANKVVNVSHAKNVVCEDVVQNVTTTDVSVENQTLFVDADVQRDKVNPPPTIENVARDVGIDPLATALLLSSIKDASADVVTSSETSKETTPADDSNVNSVLSKDWASKTTHMMKLMKE
ncbi:unnamed protein product [Citrullus colocynthis]|uniref:Uncharacterized protein n=1 Tax=Citrullus colocynthis TaxID=252529 RepID=A0ABP0YGL1_9ROSI